LQKFKDFSHLPNYTCANSDELTDKISDELISGKIIGWIQGRAEFGPRSLGNRSILADPRNPKIQEILNEKVKFREAFRPFAPAILDEKGTEYFFDYHYTPYMEKTFVFKDNQSAPGVVHQDNTGRVQSVTSTNHPLFHQLISDFYKKTNVPILLNTSLNVMGKPIVHDMEDAFGVFMGSGLDLLVVGNTIFTKHDHR
jgi:carbamoyltransferase